MKLPDTFDITATAWVDCPDCGDEYDATVSLNDVALDDLRAELETLVPEKLESRHGWRNGLCSNCTAKNDVALRGDDQRKVEVES